MGAKKSKSKKAKAGPPEKALESYLVDPPSKATVLSDYMNSPARAFLKQVCEAHDAFEHCRKKFTKKKDGQYNSDSADSLHQIAMSLVATTMGHFETYQKGLFAGVFERTRYFSTFNAKDVASALRDPKIDLVRFAAYRGLAAPVGLTIADSLSGWHSPRTVNSFFAALGLRQALFANSDVAKLELLWQLRHSIVHTGAFLTRPDSQKVAALKGYGDRALAFDYAFINVFSRRLHRIVRDATTRAHAGVLALLPNGADPIIAADVSEFLAIASPKSTWL